MYADFSPTSWTRVALGTLGGIGLCVAAALYVDSFNFAGLDSPALQRAITVDILLPTVLAGPLLFLLLSKMRQLAIAHRELSIIASTDSLTAVLNRGAFTMLVDAYLKQAQQQSNLRSGALLVVDADHFKGINDKLGHQEGDRALRIIAQTIKGVLRQADIVGRIGGEEFGVFLPGADRPEALSVAERIRASIHDAIFPQNGGGHSLSVSVGGVSFAGLANYDELFVAADACLYAAKSAGRNQVRVIQWASPPATGGSPHAA